MASALKTISALLAKTENLFGRSEKIRLSFEAQVANPENASGLLDELRALAKTAAENAERAELLNATARVGTWTCYQNTRSIRRYAELIADMLPMLEDSYAFWRDVDDLRSAWAR